jgi:integrase
MGKPRSLEAQMSYLISRHKEGSIKTHRDRQVNLQAMARELNKDFRLEKLENLKAKHVIHLVSKWKESELAISTIKNRVSQLRWVAEKMGKINMIPKSNAELGIENRTVDYNTDKGWTPTDSFKSALPEHLQIHVDLMREFGLRFEEAALLRPVENDGKTELKVIYGTKGGRDREVPIRTEAQRAVLDRARDFVDRNRQDSLRPNGMTYKKWEDSSRNTYRDAGMTKEGVGTPHGLRHQYAQDRYEELTGWKPPAQLSDDDRRAFRASMDEEMKGRDIEARQTISLEMGHGRIQVVANYVGSWSA